jgi:hypothetical protein
MTRFIVLACALVLTACGGGSSPGPLSVSGPPSAQSVSDNPSDFSGLQKCPESGSYDNYLKQEQTKNPSQYTTDSKSWSDLKAAGVNDSYIAMYAESSSDCGPIGASTPSGKVANVYAFRFKDSSSAASSFKTQSGTFHASASDISAIQAAGGTVKQGAATGLGDNSIVISIDFQGTTVYVALWQSKEFEAAILLYNLPITEGSAAATKVNGRIR